MAPKASQLANELDKLKNKNPFITEFLEKHHSIIFDQKTAQDQDYETVYELSKTALNDLVRIDGRFSRFNNTLFGSGWKNFSYSSISQEEFNILKDQLDEFMILVSPYILVSPVINCMEWLVFFYKIHLYSPETFILSILPHHDTKIFARLVRLLYIKDRESSFHWLRVVQKTDTPLTRETLVNQCLKQKWSLIFKICEFVKKTSYFIFRNQSSDTSSINTSNLSSELVKTSHSLIYSFYVSVTCGVLFGVKTKSEEETLLRGLLPFFIKGMKSRVRDYAISTYLIVMNASNSIQFTERISSEFVNLLLRRKWTQTGDISHDSVRYIPFKCILHLIRSQGIKIIPSRNVRSLLYLNDWPKLILSGFESVDYSELIYVVTQSIVEYCKQSLGENSDAGSDTERTVVFQENFWQQLSKFIFSSLENSLLNQNIFDCFLKALLDVLCSILLKSSQEELEFSKSHIGAIISKLERRMSLRFGHSLERIFKSLKIDGNNESSRMMNNFLLNSISPSSVNAVSVIECSDQRKMSVPSCEENSISYRNIFVSANHAEKEVRKRSVTAFMQILFQDPNLSQEESNDDNKLKQDLFLTFLRDEEPEVVELLLTLLAASLDKNPDFKISSFVPLDRMFPIIERLIDLSHKNADSWYGTLNSFLKHSVSRGKYSTVVPENESLMEATDRFICSISVPILIEIDSYLNARPEETEMNKKLPLTTSVVSLSTFLSATPFVIAIMTTLSSILNGDVKYLSMYKLIVSIGKKTSALIKKKSIHDKYFMTLLRTFSSILTENPLNRNRTCLLEDNKIILWVQLDELIKCFLKHEPLITREIINEFGIFHLKKLCSISDEIIKNAQNVKLLMLQSFKAKESNEKFSSDSILQKFMSEFQSHQQYLVNSSYRQDMASKFSRECLDIHFILNHVSVWCDAVKKYHQILPSEDIFHLIWKSHLFVFCQNTEPEVKIHGIVVFLHFISSICRYRGCKDKGNIALNFIIKSLSELLQSIIILDAKLDTTDSIACSALPISLVCYLNAIKHVFPESMESIQMTKDKHVFVVLILLSILMNSKSNLDLFLFRKELVFVIGEVIEKNVSNSPDCFKVIKNLFKSNSFQAESIRNDPFYICSALDQIGSSQENKSDFDLFVSEICSYLFAAVSLEDFYPSSILSVCSGLLKIICGLSKANLQIHLARYIFPLIDWFIMWKDRIKDIQANEKQFALWWLEDCARCIAKLLRNTYTNVFLEFDMTRGIESLCKWCVDDTRTIHNPNTMQFFSDFIFENLSWSFIQSIGESSRNLFIRKLIAILSSADKCSVAIRRNNLIFLRSIPISAVIFQKMVHEDFKYFEGFDFNTAMFLLECLQPGNRFTESDVLIDELFTLLERLLDNKIISQEAHENEQSGSKAGSGYLAMNREIMTHSCLLAITSCLKSGVIPHLSKLGITKITRLQSPSNGIRLGKVVECFRMFEGVAIRNAALQVVVLVAEIWPKIVLEHVMPVFTFMGSFIFQRDDKFTLKIIDETLGKLVPALSKGITGEIRMTDQKERKTTKLDDSEFSAGINILTAFADAFSQVPEHRHIPIFTKLCKVMNVSKFLAPAVVILIDRQKAAPDIESLQYFCHSLMSSFSYATQLQAVLQLVRICHALLQLLHAFLSDATTLDGSIGSNTKKRRINTSSSESSFNQSFANLDEKTSALIKILSPFEILNEKKNVNSSKKSETNGCLQELIEKFVIFVISFVIKHLQFTHNELNLVTGETEEKSHSERSNESFTGYDDIFESVVMLIALCTEDDQSKKIDEKYAKIITKKCFDLIQELSLLLSQSEFGDVFNRLTCNEKSSDLKKRGLEIYVRWISETKQFSPGGTYINKDFINDSIGSLLDMMMSSSSELLSNILNFAKSSDHRDINVKKLNAHESPKPESMAPKGVNQGIISKSEKRKYASSASTNVSCLSLLSLCQYELFALKITLKRSHGKVKLSKNNIVRIFKVLSSDMLQTIEKIHQAMQEDSLHLAGLFPDGTEGVDLVENLKVSLYLAYSELFCVTTGEHSLPYLPELVTLLIQSLEQTIVQCESKFVSVIPRLEAVLVALNRTFQSLPQFFGSYLEATISNLSQVLSLIHSTDLSAAVDFLAVDKVSLSVSNNDRTKHLATLAVGTLQKIAKTIKTPVLLSKLISILSTIQNFSKDSPSCRLLTFHVIYVFNHHFEHYSSLKSEISLETLPQLPSLLQKLVLIRSKNCWKQETDDICNNRFNELEKIIFPTIGNWLVSLSESDFKTSMLYLHDEIIVAEMSSFHQNESFHALYHLCVHLIVKMRSVAYLFIPMFWNHAIHQLTQEESRLMLKFEYYSNGFLPIILQFCSHSCSNDRNHFVPMHNCDQLCNVLVDLLILQSKVPLDDIHYDTSNKTNCLLHLGDAISNLAGSLLDYPDKWQYLHKLLLKPLLTSSYTQTKLDILSTLDPFYRKSGSDMCRNYVPNEISIFSELTEDLSDEVETKTKILLKTIESVTGESIYKNL